MAEPEIIIRPAELDDVSEIMELETSSIVHPWERKAIESLITDDNKRCLVAVADGKIAGYVGAESVLDESNIGNIVTQKEFRGKGIGTKLFLAMLDELKASGIVKVFLEVEHDNVPALRLYEKLKFVKYGHRRDYYGAGKDAVLMSLDLD